MSSPIPSPSRRSIEKSHRFWFDDGNVVIQTQDIQFRVHRSILSLHSEIMKDCFECPQPKEVDTVEGCPVIHLTDISKDVDNMCALLYGVYHFNRLSHTVDSTYLETMIRVGKKYEISYFTEEALDCLRHLFPRDLSHWESSSRRVKKIVARSNHFIFDIINLAYENQIPSILPAAFLALFTNYSTVDILSGVQRPDRSTAILRAEAIHGCLLGRLGFKNSYSEKFISSIEKSEDKTELAYRIPSLNCKCKQRCGKGLTVLACNLVTLGIMGADALTFPQNITDMCPNKSRNIFCKSCLAELETVFDYFAKLWWDCLPSLINLPDWELMDDFDTA